LGKKIIDLDDKVSKYFPQISYPDITIKNLLLHNSGLAADLSMYIHMQIKMR
jgi:CubicO group peptidase (beta-lactamase class C family)